MSTAPTYKPLEIEVTDFGPIAKAKLDLRPLTVFVGPSNTGKSYLAMLIYALHRFFGGNTMTGLARSNLLRRSPFYQFERRARVAGEEPEISEDELNELLDWGNRVVSNARAKKPTAESRIPVPETVAVLLRPVLRDVSNRVDRMVSEIARCFGIEGTAPLIRYESRRGSRVVLARHVAESDRPVSPFTYEIRMKGAEVQLSASIPNSTPLHTVADHKNPWGWERAMQLDMQASYLKSYEGIDRQLAAGSLISESAEFVGSDIISPFSRVAHYLPADRAGIMHAHRVVVASLIQRSSRAGLQRDEPLPALSGVLADFLEQLLGFGDTQSVKQKNGQDLSRILENQILRGKVRENESATGYPIFSYQPLGRVEEIPLMQSSSMVSELAPVVLYLRHLVQPGDVLIIEEPESHLHPGLQAEFTRQLAAIVQAGVRVMLTTHSDYVLEELANLIRMSELPKKHRVDIDGAEFALSPDKVGVWLFEPKMRPKGTVVKEIKLDKDAGTFPAGYGDVTEALYNKWVEIDSRIEENKPNQ